jgi:chorismate dehydratase
MNPPIDWYLNTVPTPFRLGAVSYLNTVPLVWGMLHGPQRERVRLTFSIPSVCAEEVEDDKIDIGLVPVAEIFRQRLEIVPGVSIAATGPVRSILLFANKPWRQVRTLAADLSSRTSVRLAQVILRERHGVRPHTFPAAPDLTAMLDAADAALIIGDPALRIEPDALSLPHLDLAAEWLALTGLPFVFAAWAGKPGIPVGALQKLTTQSYEFGKAHLDQIIDAEYAARGISRDLASKYLTRHIRFELGAQQLKGLEAFRELSGLESAPVAVAVR